MIKGSLTDGECATGHSQIEGCIAQPADQSLSRRRWHPQPCLGGVSNRSDSTPQTNRGLLRESRRVQGHHRPASTAETLPMRPMSAMRKDWAFASAMSEGPSAIHAVNLAHTTTRTLKCVDDPPSYCQNIAVIAQPCFIEHLRSTED